MHSRTVKEHGHIVECIACDKCGCTWLYPVEINRWATMPVALGMKPQPVHIQSDTPILVCASCGRAVFPVIEGFQINSSSYQLFDEMTKEIAGDEAEKRREGTAKEKEAIATWNNVPKKTR